MDDMPNSADHAVRRVHKLSLHDQQKILGLLSLANETRAARKIFKEIEVALKDHQAHKRWEKNVAVMEKDYKQLARASNTADELAGQIAQLSKPARGMLVFTRKGKRRKQSIDRYPKVVCRAKYIKAQLRKAKSSVGGPIRGRPSGSRLRGLVHDLCEVWERATNKKFTRSTKRNNGKEFIREVLKRANLDDRGLGEAVKQYVAARRSHGQRSRKSKKKASP